MTHAACLVVHGFGGTSFEMLPLAEALEAAGYAVSTPTLPGHAASLEDWAASTWADWYGCVEAEYDRLLAAHGRVFAMGLSMGGSLCLELARRRNPAGVATLAAPVFIYRFFPPTGPDWRLPLASVMRLVRPIWPTPPGRPESRAVAPWRGYETGLSLDALLSLLEGLRALKRGLAEITCPLLAVHATRDRQVPEVNLWEILRGVRSTTRRGVLLEIEESVTSHHLLTTHRDVKDQVARLCVEFAAQCP